MPDTNDLKQRKEDTFLAETKADIAGEDWDKFLWRAVDDDLRIKRANPAVLPQDKHRMIAYIRYDEKPPRRIVSDVKVFEDGDYGVVTCVVTLEGKSGRFHNLKVFTRTRQPPGRESGNADTGAWRNSHPNRSPVPPRRGGGRGWRPKFPGGDWLWE